MYFTILRIYVCIPSFSQLRFKISAFSNIKNHLSKTLANVTVFLKIQNISYYFRIEYFPLFYHGMSVIK